MFHLCMFFYLYIDAFACHCVFFMRVLGANSFTVMRFRMPMPSMTQSSARQLALSPPLRSSTPSSPIRLWPSLPFMGFPESRLLLSEKRGTLCLHYSGFRRTRANYHSKPF